MDYRRASKDGTYGSKNRNQSHWLKAAWPTERQRKREGGGGGEEERIWPAGCWRAELPGSSMSTCLPLPPPDSRLSLSFFFLISIFFSLHFFIFFFLVLLLLSRICSSPPGKPTARTLLLLLPLSLARAPNRYAVESRFTQIHPRTPSSSCGEAMR